MNRKDICDGLAVLFGTAKPFPKGICEPARRKILDQVKFLSKKRVAGCGAAPHSLINQSKEFTMPIPFNDIKPSDMGHSDKIYNFLCRWIVEGKLKSGEKIMDTEIASAFNISRTPVREALKRLEACKLIITIPGKETLISPINTSNIDQWYDPMAVLQQLGTKLAIKNITEGDIKELKRINADFARSLKENDIFKRFNLDRVFHSKIISISQNEYICDFCSVLFMHIQRLEYAHFKKSPYLDESVQAHESIINALELKDDYLAPMLMKEHWNSTVLSLKSIFSITDRDNTPD